ncbi:spore coat U domain-containing protein [Alkalilacustris brevis]|uniref:Csu type fimbrial protein n=1 Tax=Alkalilacustris brevis TaxID=2026338 RepID=UPI000E0CF2F4|nr:spore coat U domain-containing protein [Alkalilacustris brevis]
MKRTALPHVLAVMAAASVAGVNAAQAQTATDTFDVTITIQADCEITSTQTLNFGTVGVLTSNVDEQADIEVTCTPGTDYDVGLNEGAGPGGTIAVRQMEAAGATIDYGLYQDSARSVNWGNTPPTDTVPGTGTGTAVTHTVYGRVPPQATPAPATYTDTITVTVTF